MALGTSECCTSYNGYRDWLTMVDEARARLFGLTRSLVSATDTDSLVKRGASQRGLEGSGTK